VTLDEALLWLNDRLGKNVAAMLYLERGRHPVRRVRRRGGAAALDRGEAVRPCRPRP